MHNQNGNSGNSDSPKAGVEYASVKCSCQSLFRVLPGPDAPLFKGAPVFSDVSLREGFREQTQLPETTAMFLLAMDAKLDSILEHLAGDSLENTFPERLLVTELSGSGLSFEFADKELKTGTTLELALLLSEFPLHLAMASGRITHAAPPHYRLEFTRIDEEQRENIIRYVFQEERRQIRSMKGG